MHYTLNYELSRIDIIVNGVTVAFVPAQYFSSYPYFAALFDCQPF